ncbi:MAG: hypothetical protein IJD80_02470 [Oscillospiraceae bacterium]|nr:hypothetical protein [Oscillospiraceae bacterium]
MARKSSRKKKRIIFRLAVMAAFVLATATAMVKIVEYQAAKEAAAMPRPTPTPLLQQPNTDITKQFDSWEDYDGQVEKTINFHEETPEINMIQVPYNDHVDISYFNDVIFLGDSLADGFKVYTRTGNLPLGETDAVYLTQKSTTPRTFLQPGVRIDAGEGPVDVWAVIEQKQPGKMYITLGTNALMSMTPETLVESYQQLIDKIRSVTPQTIIYVTTITPTTYRKAVSEPRLSFDRIYQANLLLAKMCRDNGLALINLYEVLKNESGYLREEIAAKDGYHLTPKGYQEWLDYLITHTTYNPANPYI